MDLRLITLNVRSGLALDRRHAWPFRRHAVVRALDELAADVLCLQEVRWRQQRFLVRRLHGDWSACGRPRGRARSGERCLVLARRDAFEVVSCRTRWFGDTPDRPGSRLAGASHPRVATIVVLHHRASGTDLGIADVHLDPRVEEHRVQSLRQLVGWLDPGLPWVVAGDLNARPGSRSVGVLLAAGFRDALPPDAPGTFHRFDGGTDGPRLDHVFVSPGWQVVAAAVATPCPGGALISDHWPVVADLRSTDA